MDDVTKYITTTPSTAEEISASVPCATQTIRKKLLIEIQNDDTQIQAKKIGSYWIFWRVCNKGVDV
ncbi:MAG: hypothetical protein GQ576_00390 [Methanococcoides sp.]|nr:hypothetical protein [Methanococcoides sp.]